MSYNLQVVKTDDFIKVDAEGHSDVESSREALAKIARACIETGCDAVLLDVRDVGARRLGLNQLFELAVTFHKTGFQKHHKLAILHRLGLAERAEFFAMCASERGWNVRAFEEFEEAMEWFSRAEEVSQRDVPFSTGERP